MTDQRERLDVLLDRLEAPPPPLGLRTRVLAHAPRPSRGFIAEVWAALGGARVAVPAFAFAIALGVGIGVGGFGALDAADVAGSGDELDELEWALVADEYTDFET